MKTFLYLQIIGSVLTILFGVGYSIRCMIEKTDVIFVILFALIGYVGYKLLLIPSIKELKENKYYIMRFKEK